MKPYLSVRPKFLSPARLVFPFLILILVAAATGAHAAQRPARGAGQDHPMLAKIRDAVASLDLSPDQKKQIEQIVQDARQQIQSMAGDLKDLPPEQRREKLKPVFQQMIEKIKAVLTDPQKAELKQKLEAIQKERGQAAQNSPNAEALPPATQPNVDAATPARGPMLQRVRDRLAKLDLSPQQQTKIDAILDDSAKQFESLRADAQSDVSATREKARDLMDRTRQQIAGVLTSQQQQQWKESADPNPAPAAAAAKPVEAMTPQTKPQHPDPSAAKAAAASLATPAAPVESKIKSLYEGAIAPPFRLTRLNGSAVTLDSFSGKPLVLIFGSFTSPTFRDKIVQVDQLSKKYRGRASVLIVYTREAYPVNEWEVQRNLVEQIKVDQHKSVEDRTKMAKMTVDGLKIASDVAVDDIDDAATDAYDAMPNGAYVIANGKIVTRQKWADPLGLGAWIDLAIKKAK